MTEARDKAALRLAQPGFMMRALANIDNFANSDRSDPFARARAAAHYRSGVAEPDKEYHAEVTTEKVAADDGTEVVKKIFQDRKRP